MAALTQRRATLADLLPGEHVRDLVLILLGAGLTGLCAQISFHIPGTPVPVTAQTFAVLLTGAALGPGRAALSMLLYMLAGVAGVPWFAGASHGFGGATFGYIVGFIVAATLVGAIAERGGDRTLPRTLATMLIGTVLIYAFGLIWLALSLHVSLAKSFTLGAQPFLIGDAIKIVIATGLLPGAWWLVGRNR
jgi:biotin transport system substrate-specific component